MAKIWYHKELTIEHLHSFYKQREFMPHFLEIELTELGDDYLVAKMPVNEKTKQDMGLLHGGASAVLAETVGSIASNLCLPYPEKYAVGLSIVVNHLKSARKGYVFAKATPIKLGRNIHVWDIKIRDEENNLISSSTLTMAVLENKKI